MITAKEFCKNLDEEIGEYWSNDYDELPNQMIEFAKLHVKASLEAASEQAVAKENPADYGTGEIWVDERSILSAYPLENIK